MNLAGLKLNESAVEIRVGPFVMKQNTEERALVHRDNIQSNVRLVDSEKTTATHLSLHF